MDTDKTEKTPKTTTNAINPASTSDKTESKKKTKPKKTTPNQKQNLPKEKTLNHNHRSRLLQTHQTQATLLHHHKNRIQPNRPNINKSKPQLQNGNYKPTHRKCTRKRRKTLQQLTRTLLKRNTPLS